MNVKCARPIVARGLLGLLLLALLFTVSTRPVAAQVLYGSVVGTVTDPSGAVIPGATVTLTSKQIGVNRSDKTDDGGRYSFVNVLPGTYDVNVGATGFRTFIAAGVGRHTEHRSPRRFQTRSRPDRRSGNRRRHGRRCCKPINPTRTRRSTATAITSLPHRRLPQLPDADQPGARRTPAALQNSITDTPGRALQHAHQRRQRADQHHPHRRRHQRERVAAAPCRLRGAGRERRRRSTSPPARRTPSRAWRARRRSPWSPSPAPTRSTAARSSSTTTST